MPRGILLASFSGEREYPFRKLPEKCSRSFRKGVHVEPEWVFTLGRNTQIGEEVTMRIEKLSAAAINE